MDEVTGQIRTEKLPCFVFTYVVNGEYFSGRFALRGAEDREDILMKDLIGTKVAVYYNPMQPSAFNIFHEPAKGCEVIALPD